MVKVARLLILLFGIRGSRPKVRKLHIRVTVDLASLPGPPEFLHNSWIQVDAGHLLVLIFLLGLTVLVFWLGSLPFLVLCTGHLVLLTWVMMGSPFWNFSYFSNSGLGRRVAW